jgi:hypothetical protein
MQVLLFAACSAAPVVAMERFVTPGQSLQEVLNQASPGDVITLQAGATFTGNFVLPKKSGSSWITIRSSMMASLPAAGKRVSPSHAPYMAKLMSPNGAAALAAAAGAHHYRIQGLEMRSAPGIFTYCVVQLGVGTETSLDQLPYSLEFDRVYIHGDRVVGGKRGIALNSRSTNILNSYLSDFKSASHEAQAILGWNGPGPFQIINNYLEATGENVMFGGAKVAIPNVLPSDIVIKRNHFFKPLTWKPTSPTYGGTRYIVKNLFELKTGRRVTVDGNVFENNWVHSQNGFGILFTVRTENGRVPWAVVEDVVFSNNIIRNVDHGINMMAKDGSYGGALRRVTVRNNLFEDVHSRWIQLLNGCNYVTIDHNTAFHGTLGIFFDGTVQVQGFVFRNNVMTRGTYSIYGSGRGEGNWALAGYAPGAVVTRNVFAGAPASMYPTGNYFPASLNGVVNTFSGQYTLSSDSPYRYVGTDGKDPGVDFTALTAATAGVAADQ